jgi:3-phosphoshikimate 1-carboxyvinyltransferase
VRTVFDAGDVLSHEFTYPDQLEIQPLAACGVASTVTVPGSKSITNRALVLAALASYWSECTLTGALQSEDTEVMVDCLQRLGFVIHTDWPTIRVEQNRTGRIIPSERADLFVANSGTTARFVAAMVSLGHGAYRLDGVPRMRQRPIQDLLDALNQLGANARSDNGTGCPPITIEAHGWKGGAVEVRADTSSQFYSGLILAAPFAENPTHFFTRGRPVSWPYIEMTSRMSWDWGLTRFSSGGTLAPDTVLRHAYEIEPDASAASYFWAAAAILSGRVTVSGLTGKSIQGDVGFVDVLERMGCRIEKCDAGITVHGRPLHGIDIDMNAISDTVMTLAAVACFAEGPTRIRNVAHIRHKETDRIAALTTELRRLGAEVEEFADGLTITPRPLHGAAIETYNDHRMAMSLALIGLKVPGVIIKNPGCVAKTYPGFWRDLEKLR